GGGGITFSITTDSAADQVQLQAEIREVLDGLSGVGEVSLASAGSAFSSQDIDINLTANSQSDLRRAAQDVLDAVADLDVTAEATSNLSEPQEYIEVVVDREEAARVGLGEFAIGSMVSQAMQPSPIGSVVIDDKTMSIYLLTEDPPTTVEELREFTIPTPLGPRDLGELASVERTE